MIEGEKEAVYPLREGQHVSVHLPAFCHRRPGGMSWDDMIDSLVKHAVDSVRLFQEDVECWDTYPGDFEPQDCVVRDDIRDIVRQALEDHGIDPDALHD